MGPADSYLPPGCGRQEERDFRLPPPNRRHDPTPEDLARAVADRLARSKPTTVRFSLRDSVLVGRIVTGVTALVSIALVVAGVVTGANWLLARTTEPHPEVLANTFDVNGAGGEAAADATMSTTPDGTLLPLVTLMFPTPLSSTTDSVDRPGPAAATVPPATTTTTTSAPVTSNPVVSTSMPTTTSVPETGGVSSSTTTTTTRPSPTTTSGTTTTTAPPTTTTTASTTTTTTAASTTTTTATTSTTTETSTTTTTRPSPPSTPGRGG